MGNGQWPNRARGIGKIYQAIFAQIMNNFYSLLLFSSPLFLRVLRAFAVRKKKPIANHKKLPFSKNINVERA
ncbi:hypothetical protein QUA82_34625 [Microcoleus sp. F8-D3]